MNNNQPQLLKARQYHSRVFAAAAVAFLLVTAPEMAAREFPRECMLWLGYALVILGAFGRAYCSAYIGGRKNDVIVREGPFSVARNPLYVFSFIAVTGIGLQSGMWTLLILLATAFLLYYPQVVSREEAFLANKFGNDYMEYMRAVPRWIPNFKLWREPESIESHPRFIRRTLMDAAIFFLPMPCFAIIEALHARDILPVWWTLM